MIRNRFFLDEFSSSNEETSDVEQEIEIETEDADFFRVSYNANRNNDEDNVKRIVRSQKQKR